jgi:peptidyl-prolyl cis-trans isomerase D
LVIVSKKTNPLKLSTQNLKNVELISASNLNTLSLLKAKQIIASKFKGTTLEDFVKSSGFPAQRVDSLSFASPFVPGLGAEPKVIGAAFNKSLIGKNTAAIEGTAGVFAVKPEGIGASASMQDPAAISSALLQAVQSNIFRGFEAIKKSAKITDNRSTFY